MMVPTQRTTVHTAVNAGWLSDRCPSIPCPIDEPNTISAAPIPPRIAVATMSITPMTRAPMNFRSSGTS